MYAEVKCDASGKQKQCQSLHIIYLLHLIRFMIFNAHHIQHYELLTYVFSAAIFHGKIFHKSRISNDLPSVRHFYFEAINEGNKMKKISTYGKQI